MMIIGHINKSRTIDMVIAELKSDKGPTYFGPQCANVLD